MKKTIKYDNLHNSVNQLKIDELCKTIIENCETPLGWEHLTKLSGFTHRELIGLFRFTSRLHLWHLSRMPDILRKLKRQTFRIINFSQN